MILTNICLHITYILNIETSVFKTLILFYSIFLYFIFLLTKVIIGVGIVQSQFIRLSTTAAVIWQQMIRIPEISTILKRNKHNKQQSGEVLIAQLRDYHIQQSPYNASYSNIDTPIKW